MDASMMMRPLLISDILTYATEAHGSVRMVSYRCEGDRHEQSYAEAAARATQMSFALEELGIVEGDRVATLAWNSHRHFELYYAIQGIGAVCHTINPRLSREQMIYIITHAEDKILFTDLTFVPLLEGLRDEFPGLRYVIMTDRAHMPANKLDALCFEELLGGHPETRDWPDLDENSAAGLCYTSGTTGDPKGALYSQRSTVLHTLISGVTNSREANDGSCILPVVPMFHVNAWGLPYLAPLMGAELVMPGPKLDGPSLYRQITDEGVTAAWGVPTIWMGLLAEIEAQGRKPDSFRHIVVGGSAAPRSMIETFERMGVDVNHAWGMTEMSPIGSLGILPKAARSASFEERMDLKCLQGRRVPFVDMKLIDEEGARQPHDGQSEGELCVRGNTIAAGYFNNPEASAKSRDAEGWFITGDIATITPDGYLQLRDRAKDLIKSGGEWISSIDLENAATALPKVEMCAAIAVPHPKWDERPVMVAVAADPADPPSLAEIHAALEPHFAKWQLPDDLILIEEMPMTATGKISKLSLRKQLADYVLPDLRK